MEKIKGHSLACRKPKFTNKQKDIILDVFTQNLFSMKNSLATLKELHGIKMSRVNAYRIIHKIKSGEYNGHIIDVKQFEDVYNDNITPALLPEIISTEEDVTPDTDHSSPVKIMVVNARDVEMSILERMSLLIPHERDLNKLANAYRVLTDALEISKGINKQDDIITRITEELKKRHDEKNRIKGNFQNDPSVDQ